MGVENQTLYPDLLVKKSKFELSSPQFVRARRFKVYFTKYDTLKLKNID